MSDQFAVDVSHLSKSFNGKPAVMDVSLQIPQGQIFGFLGPNGSGKTTTIRMLCGLLVPDEGEGTCLGFDIISDTQQIKRLVGYVPQSFGLYRDLTVRENLEFIARVYGMRDYRSRAKNIMAELGLDEYKNILSGRLSGGWKQRLSLGAALIHEPRLLLLDEPTAGVDPKARREFWNYITTLTSKGITALVSTHYMDEAERCNTLAYIVDGRVMTTGTIPEIIRQAGLTTWSGAGKNLSDLSREIKREPGVQQTVMWGNNLRVTGTDSELIQCAVSKYPQYHWEQTRPGLEEVFVHFVAVRAEEERGTA